VWYIRFVRDSVGCRTILLRFAGGGMPKLILFVVCLVVFAAFSVMNANNKCDINFIFKKFEEVNIVIALVFSFTLGVLFTLPIALAGRARAAKRAEEKTTNAKMTRAEKKAAKQAENETKKSDTPEAPL
jgi:hypothetical protein